MTDPKKRWSLGFEMVATVEKNHTNPFGAPASYVAQVRQDEDTVTREGATAEEALLNVARALFQEAR